MKISSENEILDCIRLETLKINIPAHSDFEKGRTLFCREQS